MIAVVAAVALVAATCLKLYASLRLLHEFQHKDYLATRTGRCLFAIHICMPVIMAGSMLVLAYCTALLWVEIPLWLVFLATVVHCGRVASLRLSGSYKPSSTGHA
jgi:hypothetical protein